MAEVAPNYGLRVAFFVGAILLCLAMLGGYVLSVKPAGWLMANEYMSEDFYLTLYRPLFWLGDHFKPLGDFLTDYLEGI